MTRHLVTPQDEMDRVAARSTQRIVQLIRRVARARVLGDAEQYRDAMEDAAATFGDVLALCDLLGRRRIQLLYERAEEPEDRRASMASFEVARLSEDLTPLLPKIESDSVIADILLRMPELAVGFKAVQEVYRNRHGFACARAMDVAVTERVQAVVSEALRTGDRAGAKKVLMEIEDWSGAYADTVYETNVRTAYTAGMFARMEDPAVARVLPGVRFVSALMITSRPNHTAAHGLMAPSTHPIWSTFSPPLGYRCKCALREVSVIEAKSKGLLDANGMMRVIYPSTFSQAYPDPGFGRGRPSVRASSGDIG
jgi:hypothetical protein